MTKQHRDVEEGDAGQEQFDREGVTEPMRVGVGDIGEGEQRAEGALPVGDSGLGVAVTAPEIKVSICSDQLQRDLAYFREREHYWRARLLGVQE